nr:MAG TPA: hypothetical protein [Caudoviricetes sp.]
MMKIIPSGRRLLSRSCLMRMRMKSICIGPRLIGRCPERKSKGKGCCASRSHNHKDIGQTRSVPLRVRGGLLFQP